MYFSCPIFAISYLFTNYKFAYSFPYLLFKKITCTFEKFITFFFINYSFIYKFFLDIFYCFYLNLHSVKFIMMKEKRI